MQRIMSNVFQMVITLCLILTQALYQAHGVT